MHSFICGLLRSGNGFRVLCIIHASALAGHMPHVPGEGGPALGVCGPALGDTQPDLVRGAGELSMSSSMALSLLTGMVHACRIQMLDGVRYLVVWNPLILMGERQRLSSILSQSQPTHVQFTLCFCFFEQRVPCMRRPALCAALHGHRSLCGGAAQGGPRGAGAAGQGRGAPRPCWAVRIQCQCPEQHAERHDADIIMTSVCKARERGFWQVWTKYSQITLKIRQH